MILLPTPLLTTIVEIHKGCRCIAFAIHRLAYFSGHLTGTRNGVKETVVLFSKGEIDSKNNRVAFSLADMDMSEFHRTNLAGSEPSIYPQSTTIWPPLTFAFDATQLTLAVYLDRYLLMRYDVSVPDTNTGKEKVV